MFRHGLTCALEPLPDTVPAVLWGEAESVTHQAAAMGYDGVELFLRQPRQYNPARLARAASDAGIAYCAITTGMEYTKNGLSLISGDPLVRNAAIHRLKEHIDLAARLECPVVVGMMRASIPEGENRGQCHSRLAEALAVLCDYAAETGVVVFVEAILRYISNYLNTAHETAAFLRTVHRGNLKLHLDTHSMLIEEADLPAAILAHGDQLGYIHYSDSNRCYPGAGNIDFVSVTQALIKGGYDGFITVECLPKPDGPTCARRALEQMRAMEALCDAQFQMSDRK